ncbi:hypothetical protein Pla110_02700 [Polystyrenella longa]|uniref:Uncharacterized protein n=1 Tax=Polystyrenella longa TaxID=2528007 RepID=A0A518CH65_9PLAN|nr:hypothetical protein [Polystyrenella longa]QDU78566.1 hypothetical protein Pla110_02700 [Polystyrenella longa]
MFRIKRTLLALLTVICAFSLVKVTIAADSRPWKMEISPRFTLDRETGETITPVRQQVLFRVAQAEETQPVPPPVEAIAPAVETPVAETPTVETPTVETPTVEVPVEAEAVQPAPAPEAQLPTIVPSRTIAQTSVPNYTEIYKSIPFNRAEYLANPSYRHEATMSILLKQPYVTNGPKNIRQRVPKAVRTSPWSKTTPWFNSGGNLFPFPGAGYGYGLSPFWP